MSRAVSVWLVAASVACETLIHIEDRYFVPSCNHRQPPARLTLTDASFIDAQGGGAPDPLVLAVWETDWGFTSSDDAGRLLYQDLGFDLDNVCTGAGQAPSCLEPGGAAQRHRDLVDGIDNAYGQRWYNQPIPDRIYAASGRAEPIFRIRGYSGEPDDDQVEVCLYVALGLETRGAGDAGAAGGEGGVDERGGGAEGGTVEDGSADGSIEPLWDGHDRWRILTEVLDAPEDAGSPSASRPRFCDEMAYVSGGMLVAHFNGVLWPAPIQTVAPTWLLPVEELILAGRLTRVGFRNDAWELQDAVTGQRAALTDLLTWTALSLPSGSTPLCSSPPVYDLFKTRLCALADLGSEAGRPCDSESAGFLLQARQAELGDISPLPPADISALASRWCDPSARLGADTCDSPRGDE